MTNIKSLATAGAFLLFAMIMTGCSPENGNQPAATAAVSAPAAVVDEKQQDDDLVSELAGTSWRLVNIRGMDDSNAAPDDRSLYTLEFSGDGNATMRADCNRGMGSWISASPGQLQFGPVAATRAMCPPESLSDKYLAQFEWVRSYVMNDGHLFMATMADGAIIEFEPLLPSEEP